MSLPAHALSIKEGGEIQELRVMGNLETNGDDITTFIIEKGGEIINEKIEGKLIANGHNSKEKEIL